MSANSHLTTSAYVYDFVHERQQAYFRILQFSLSFD